MLYLSNPDGVDADTRSQMLDGIAKLNASRFDSVGGPEIETRIAQYEMAYRMQTSVPDLMDTSGRVRSDLRIVWPGCEKAWDFCRKLPSRTTTANVASRVASALSPRLGPTRQPSQGDS